MKQEKSEPKRKNKRVLTLFILMTVSLLIAMSSAIPSWSVRMFFQVVLLFLDFVLLKNLLDDYYGE